MQYYRIGKDDIGIALTGLVGERSLFACLINGAIFEPSATKVVSKT